MSNNTNIDNEDKINLKDLYTFLKVNKKFLLKITILFMMFTSIYNFFIAESVYGYETLIRFPKSVNAAQVNSFLAIFKDDIKPEEWLNDDKNRITDVIILERSAVIKFYFEGESPEKVKKFGDIYTKKALGKINKIIVEDEKVKFNKEELNMIKNDLTYISSKLHESFFSTTDAIERLNYLYEKIKLKSENEMFMKAELVKDGYLPPKALSPNVVKNIVGMTILGFLLACIYKTLFFIFQQHEV